MEVASANQEAVEAWDGVLFDRFVQFREMLVSGLAMFGDRAMAVCPPPAGGRVLDIGCGFGDTTLQLAKLVGAEGRAVGIDSSLRFIETARTEAADADVGNAEFMVGDVQAADLGGPYEYAFSRFGTMFFANPVAALRNVARALEPGGTLCMVVWRRKLDNAWVHLTEGVVKGMVTEDEESDELTCGPGPFSMANADTVSEIVQTAGLESVTLCRCDESMPVGGDLGAAAELAMALGPAAEAIRLAGDDADRQRPAIKAAVMDALRELDGGDGVRSPTSTWIVTARKPAQG